MKRAPNDPIARAPRKRGSGRPNPVARDGRMRERKEPNKKREAQRRAARGSALKSE